jgi:hypothetical protein
MVRDSFTMPENDYAILGELKKNALNPVYTLKRVNCFARD